MNCIKNRMMPLGFYYWKYITELSKSSVQRQTNKVFSRFFQKCSKLQLQVLRQGHMTLRTP